MEELNLSESDQRLLKILRATLPVMSEQALSILFGETALQCATNADTEVPEWLMQIGLDLADHRDGTDFAQVGKTV